jgi:hypothetical protein
MHPFFAPIERQLLEKLRSKNIGQAMLLYSSRLLQATHFYYQKHHLLSPASLDNDEERIKELNQLEVHMIEECLKGQTNMETLRMAHMLQKDEDSMDPVAW